MSPYRRDESQPSPVRAPQWAVAAACLLAAGGAQGQVSGTVSLASEYSARGVSLSNGRAAPQLGLSYDAPAGWFAGAFVAPRLTLAGRSGITQLVAYGGYARRLPSGLSWEAGASSTAFPQLPRYNYREFFLGLASERLGGRVYVAPDWYGYGGRVAYAELNGFHPVGERVRLIAHAGVLRGLGGPAARVRDRVDLRLAIGADVGQCNVQLAWLATAGRAVGIAGAHAPRALALSASWSF